MTRNRVILTGLTGVVGAILLTAFCLFLVVAEIIPVLFTQPFIVWGLFLFLLFFSVIEIPMMIMGLQRIGESPNPKAHYVVLFTVVGFTFFAGVYAAPFILLAGHSTLTLVAGTALGLLSLVRFIAAVAYIPAYAKQP